MVLPAPSTYASHPPACVSIIYIESSVRCPIRFRASCKSQDQLRKATCTRPEFFFLLLLTLQKALKHIGHRMSLCSILLAGPHCDVRYINFDSQLVHAAILVNLTWVETESILIAQFFCYQSEGLLQILFVTLVKPACRNLCKFLEKLRPIYSGSISSLISGTRSLGIREIENSATAPEDPAAPGKISIW